MIYRMDWRIQFGVNQRASAERLLCQLCERWSDAATIEAVVPNHAERGVWDAHVSAGPWDMLFGDAVVRCIRMAEGTAVGTAWGYSLGPSPGHAALFHGFLAAHGPARLRTWLSGLHTAEFALVDAATAPDRPSVWRTTEDDFAQPHTVWIEAEAFEPGTWHAESEYCNVIVTFGNGDRWAAVFASYASIAAWRAEHRATGERLAGRYTWTPHMVLVEEITRPLVEAVVRDLLESGDFEKAFGWCGG